MYIYFLLYYLFIHLTLLVPGYGIIKRTKLLSENTGLELSASYAATIVVMSLIAVCGYSFGVNWGILRIAGWLWIVFGSAFFIKQKLWRAIWTQRLPLICFGLISIMSLAFISLNYTNKPKFIPDPQPIASSDYSSFDVKVLNVSQTVANDNSVPYRQAQFFINGSNPAKDSFIDEWGVHFFQRTPLMGAVTAGYFNLLNEHPPLDYIWKRVAVDPGHTFVKFQIIAIILNGLFILPAYFLLTKFFSKKTAITSTMFFVVSPYFIYNSFFSWPKSLAAFFTLLMWCLLLENKFKYTVLAAVAAGLAYLTHDLAVLYIGTSVVFLLANRRWRDTIILGGVSAVLALPWLYTSAVIFKKPSTFIYYPFSTAGIPQIAQRKLVLDTFFHTPVIEIIRVRLQNLFYLLSPYQLLSSEGNQDLGRRLWALNLFSVTGALGLGLLAPVYIATLKGLKKLSFWILVLVPVVLSVVIIGWPKGLGALHFAQPVVVLLTGLAIAYLLGMRDKRWLILAFLVNIIQLIFFLVYSYGFATESWLHTTSDLLAILIMIAIVVATVTLVYSLSFKPKRSLILALGHVFGIEG